MYMCVWSYVVTDWLSETYLKMVIDKRVFFLINSLQVSQLFIHEYAKVGNLKVIETGSSGVQIPIENSKEWSHKCRKSSLI